MKISTVCLRLLIRCVREGTQIPSTYFMVCMLSSVFPYYLTEFVLQSCEAGIRNMNVSVLEIGEPGDFPKINGCPSYQISRLLFLCCPSCHCPSACWNVLRRVPQILSFGEVRGRLTALPPSNRLWHLRKGFRLCCPLPSPSPVTYWAYIK